MEMRSIIDHPPQRFIKILSPLFAHWIRSKSVGSEALADYLKWQFSWRVASFEKLSWLGSPNIPNSDKNWGKSDPSETGSYRYLTSLIRAAMAGRRSLNAFLAFNFFLVIAGLLSYRAIYSARSKEPAITESSLKAQSGNCCCNRFCELAPLMTYEAATVVRYCIALSEYYNITHVEKLRCNVGFYFNSWKYSPDSNHIIAWWIDSVRSRTRTTGINYFYWWEHLKQQDDVSVRVLPILECMIDVLKYCYMTIWCDDE